MGVTVLLRFIPFLAVLIHCSLNALQQMIIGVGLFDQIKGALAHCLCCHGHIGVTCHHNDRYIRVNRMKSTIYFKSVHSRHAYVKEYAAQGVGQIPRQEIFAVGMQLTLQLGGLEQPPKGFAHPLVVINNKYGYFFRHYPYSVAGSV